jgi:hypothetical protein
MLAALLRDSSGSAAIETAFVLPVLALMSFGGFEVSQLIARNTELESAAAEATAISLASRPRTQNEMIAIERVIEASTGLADENVVLTRQFRCGVAAQRVAQDTLCQASDIVAEYIEITLSETHHPVWTQIGVGSDMEFTVTKTVQIG